MDEYQSGRFTNALLARRHGVSLSTISHWARKANLTQKPRGRRSLDKPNATQQEMIELSAHLTLAKIAERFGVSRQRVHQVLKRWSQLRPTPPPAAEVHPNLAPVRHVRELKDTVVSFRLSAPQIGRVNEMLHMVELPKRVSRNQACRLFLLAALGCTPMALALPNDQGNTAPWVGQSNHRQDFRLVQKLLEANGLCCKFEVKRPSLKCKQNRSTGGRCRVTRSSPLLA